MHLLPLGGLFLHGHQLRVALPILLVLRLVTHHTTICHIATSEPLSPLQTPGRNVFNLVASNQNHNGLGGLLIKLEMFPRMASTGAMTFTQYPTNNDAGSGQACKQGSVRHLLALWCFIGCNAPLQLQIIK